MKSDLQEARLNFGSVKSPQYSTPDSESLPRRYPDAIFDSGHCACCADRAEHGRVLELIGGGLARVDLDGAIEEVSVELVDAVPGDLILVHARVAIARLDGAV